MPEALLRSVHMSGWSTELVMGSSLCELALGMGRGFFRTIVLSANFLTEDFLRLMCENLFLWSSWLIFPKEVPVVFCLERWWVMFKPGCWRSGARLGKRGVKVSVFFLILMMACYLSTGCPHPVSPEHLWLHVCRESPLCDGLGVVVV